MRKFWLISLILLVAGCGSTAQRLSASPTITQPTVTGTAEVGHTLTVGHPAGATVAWDQCGNTTKWCGEIPASVGDWSYTIPASEKGYSLRAQVTGPSGAVGVSNATAVVAKLSVAWTIVPKDCVSDCAYEVNLTWTIPPFLNQTGYYVLENSSQVGSPTSSPYTFEGLECGTTYTLGVEAHNAGGGTGPLYTVDATMPSCTPFLAGDKFVSSGGSDSANGSESTPYASIGKCASVITAGNTCWIETGTYTDTDVDPANEGTSSANMITFMNYPGEAPVLNGGSAASPAFNIYDKNYVRISGLTVEYYSPTTSGDGPDIGGAVEFVNSIGSEADHDTVEHTIVSSGADAGIFVDNGLTTQDPYTILDNYVTDTENSGAGSGVESDGIDVAGGDYYTGGLVQGNVTTDNEKDGIRFECSAPGTEGTLGVSHTATVTVQDNIAMNNVTAGIDPNGCYATVSYAVQNNFLMDNKQAEILMKHSDNALVTHNTLVGKTSGLQTGTGGDGFGCSYGQDCEDGVDYLGPSTLTDVCNYGNAYGGTWDQTTKDNIIYGGLFMTDVLEPNYALLQGGTGTGGTCAASSPGAIDYNDLYGWDTTDDGGIMAFADEHLCNGSTPVSPVTAACTGNGGYFQPTTFASWKSNTGWDAHSVSVDPVFTDAAAGNYTLGSSSTIKTDSDTGNALGADPTQLTGVGPQGNYSLADVNGS